jgi:ribosomal-protein-alanine N-acetyltransferase
MRDTPTLTAPGIALRPLRVEDAPALFIAHSDPAVHHFWSGPAHESLGETERYINDTIATPGALCWAITKDGGEALGRIGLFEKREGVAEFGIILRRDAHGLGLGRKSIELAGAYGFEKLGLHRLVADIDPDNAASLALFTRAGFVREGLLRQNWKTHLGRRDTVLMAKLRDDSPVQT